jgi:predicted phosphodiesterase
VTELASARIGVVSDTHGNREFLALAREILVEREGIDRAYHLGDDYADAEWMTDWNVPVVAVPGLHCPEYAAGRAPRFVKERVAGRTHLVVHAPTSLPAGILVGVDVLFCGHTHLCDDARDGDLTRINPGHMKCCVHKERVATCALVEANPDGIDAHVFSVETGEPVMREMFE